jgi:hypothetical protein
MTTPDPEAPGPAVTTNPAVTTGPAATADPAATPAVRPTSWHAGGLAAVAGPRLAALLLGAACVVWTASPLRPGGLAETALVIAITAVTAGALRLAFTEVPVPEEQYFYSGWQQAWTTFLGLLRALPWEELAAVALLWLEIQHPLRPWHTFALGAALVAYLLATHIAESGAEAGPLLRRQARLLVAGACLLALGAGLAMIPAAAPGAGSAVLRVIAAVAVVAAAALVAAG